MNAPRVRLPRRVLRFATAAGAACGLVAVTLVAGAQTPKPLIYRQSTEWGEVTAGQELQVIGRGFPAGSSGKIHWQDARNLELAGFTAGRDGTFNAVIRIPADAARGPAAATACENQRTGCSAVATARMTVAPAPAPVPAPPPQGPGPPPGPPGHDPSGPPSPDGGSPAPGSTDPLPTSPPPTPTRPPPETPTPLPTGTFYTLPPPPFEPPVAQQTLSPGAPPVASEENIPNLKITHMEITQGIQNLHNMFPLVRNRRTWVRVYITTSGAGQAGVMAALEGVRQTGDGPEPLGVLFAENAPVTVQNVHPKITNEQRLDHGSVPYFRLPDDWTKGTVKFRAWVWKGDPQADNEPSSEDNLFEVEEYFDPARELRVFLFGLYIHRNFDPAEPPEIHTILDPWVKAFAHLRRMLPVGGLYALPYPFVFGNENSHWDLRVPDGDPHEPRLELLEWHEMAGLPDNDIFTGMVSPDPSVGGLMTFKGIAWAGQPANWAVMSDFFRQSFPWAHVGGEVWAHELGHSMGIDHAPCAPGEGVDHAGEFAGGPIDWTWPSALYGFPDCSLAPTDPEGYYGFDPRPEWVGTEAPTVLSNDPDTPAPNVAWPWMGYKNPGWLDPWHGCDILQFLDVACEGGELGFIPGGPAPGGGTVPPPAPGGGQGVVSGQFQCHLLEEDQFCQTFTDTLPPDSAEIPDDLLISGFVRPADGTGGIDRMVEIPAPRRRARPSLTGEAAGKGPFLLVLRDADGRIRWANLVRTGGTGAGPAPPTEWFSIRAPRLPNLASVELVSPGGVVAQRRPSASRPSVELTSAGIRGGSLEVSWSSSDPDQDPLIAYLFYRPSASRPWQPIGHNLRGTTFKLPGPDLLPGGERAQVRLLVSDGFHTVAAQSRPFRVARRAPLVMILSPAPGESRPAGRAMDFEGQGTDPEDGILTGRRLEWRSSRDGRLGTGARLSPAGLSPGRHTITLSATDSDGRTGESKVEVTVAPRNLPDSSTRRAVEAVLTNERSMEAEEKASPLGIVVVGVVVLSAAAAVLVLRRRRTESPLS